MSIKLYRERLREEVSLLYLKIGSNITDFHKMQPKDWSIPPKRLAYIGQVNALSPVKIDLGRGVTLDIPYAKTSLLIMNSRLNDFSLVTNPNRESQKIKEAKALYKNLYRVLEKHPDWYFNVKLDRWMRISNQTKRLRSEESIMLDLHPNRVSSLPVL